MILPSPLHAVHSIAMLIKPCLYNIFPEPPQVEHCVGEEPGRHFEPLHAEQTETLSTEMIFWQPLIASIKDISIDVIISRPFFDFSPLVDSAPKKSSNPSQKSLKFPAPPVLPKPPPKGSNRISCIIY